MAAQQPPPVEEARPAEAPRSREEAPPATPSSPAVARAHAALQFARLHGLLRAGRTLEDPEDKGPAIEVYNAILDADADSPADASDTTTLAHLAALRLARLEFDLPAPPPNMCSRYAEPSKCAQLMRACHTTERVDEGGVTYHLAGLGWTPAEARADDAPRFVFRREVATDDEPEVDHFDLVHLSACHGRSIIVYDTDDRRITDDAAVPYDCRARDWSVRFTIGDVEHRHTIAQGDPKLLECPDDTNILHLAERRLPRP